MTSHELRTNSRMRAAGVSLLMALTMALFASSAYASIAFTWSPPQLVTAAGVTDLTRMACAPNSTLCVGADLFNGDIAASANATGGAGEWAVANVDGRAVASNGQSESEIEQISCPATTLCVAVDSSGHILYSTKPAEPSTWHKITPTAGEGGLLGSVACPSTSLCLVSDSAGTVLTSTNPAGGSGAWTATKLAVTPNLVGCESSTLCIAVSPAGEVVSSTEPTGGAGKWSAASERLETSANPVRISCTTTFCALADNIGNILTSTNPGASAHEWSSAAVTGEFINALSCPSAGLCVAQVGGFNAAIYYSTNPTGGSSEWKRYQPPSGELSGVTTVACASTTLCIGGLFNGVLTTTTPTTETTSWTKSSLPAATGLAHVSCSSTSFCAAIEAGNIFTSTDPSKENATWTSAAVDKSASLAGLSCVPAGTLCVAVDGSGNVFTSTEPAGGATKWTKTTISGAGFLAGVSCPTASFCTIVDQQGHVITSTTPTSGTWNVSSSLSGSPILATVSCPSSSFCAATELSGGKVFASTKPAAGAAEWKGTELEGASFLNGIGCASATLCVTGDGTDAYATTEPTGGASKWTKEALGWITDAACPTENLCVASAYFGELLTASEPTAGVGAWSATKVDFYERGLNSVSCPTSAFCAAVDGSGDVVTGTATGPGNTTPPKIKGEAVVGATLTEEHGVWTNGPILGYEYEWQRCTSPSSCTKIPGTEAQTLALTAEDEGFEVRVLERARNNEGTSAPVASELVGPIEAGAHHEEHKEETKTTTTSSGGNNGVSSGGSGGSGGATATISSAQVIASLTSTLTLSGKAATVKSLLAKGGITLSCSALEPGVLVVDWYEVPHGAKLAAAKARPVLVAAGKLDFGVAEKATLKLKLTSAGKKLLRHALHLKLTGKATFTPTGQGPISTTKAFVLKRG
jgi:hypothetical protein